MYRLINILTEIVLHGKLRSSTQRVFSDILQDCVIKYYDYISDDRVLFIKRSPRALTIIFEPGVCIVPPDDCRDYLPEVFTALTKYITFVVVTGYGKSHLEAAEYISEFARLRAIHPEVYYNPVVLVATIVLEMNTLLKKLHDTKLTHDMKVNLEYIMTCLDKLESSLKTSMFSDANFPNVVPSQISLIMDKDVLDRLDCVAVKN